MFIYTRLLSNFVSVIIRLGLTQWWPYSWILCSHSSQYLIWLPLPCVCSHLCNNSKFFNFFGQPWGIKRSFPFGNCIGACLSNTSKSKTFHVAHVLSVSRLETICSQGWAKRSSTKSGWLNFFYTRWNRTSLLFLVRWHLHYSQLTFKGSTENDRERVFKARRLL